MIKICRKQCFLNYHKYSFLNKFLSVLLNPLEFPLIKLLIGCSSLDLLDFFISHPKCFCFFLIIIISFLSVIPNVFILFYFHYLISFSHSKCIRSSNDSSSVDCLLRQTIEALFGAKN